jgi:3-oxoacyl-[acyl-carrier-protein] synthase II
VPLPVTSIKAHTGHLSAPSGTLAIVAAVLAMKEGSLVHTAGTKDVEDAVRFDVVIEKPRPLELNRIMVNGFGFGGQDASIVIGRPAS